MPYKIAWYVEKRLIYVQVNGEISIRDFKEINARMVAYLEEGHAPVHLIGNNGDVDKMPISIRELKKNLTFMSHPNIGMVVGVGEANVLVKFLVPIILNMAGINYIRRYTTADALDYIKNHDATIDWQQADDGVLLDMESH